MKVQHNAIQARVCVGIRMGRGGGGLFWPIACFVELTSCRSHPSYLYNKINFAIKNYFSLCSSSNFLKNDFLAGEPWPSSDSKNARQKFAHAQYNSE